MGEIMARTTSVQAFHTIQSNGLLSKARFNVYRALYQDGPVTRNELSAILEARWGIRINPNLVSSRLNELRAMGVALEAGNKVCPITGMTTINWDVTDQLPGKPPKRDRTRVKCGTCSGKGWMPVAKTQVRPDHSQLSFLGQVSA
jgi:hypothetical protein